MRKIVAGRVEQHFPETSAEHDAEHAVEQEVVEMRRRPPDRRQLPADAHPPERDELQESRQVHQSVPVDRHRSDLHRDGIELGMDQHALTAS